jgi:hypothetical protein
LLVDVNHYNLATVAFQVVYETAFEDALRVLHEKDKNHSSIFS